MTCKVSSATKSQGTDCSRCQARQPSLTRYLSFVLFGFYVWYEWSTEHKKPTLLKCKSSSGHRGSQNATYVQNCVAAGIWSDYLWQRHHVDVFHPWPHALHFCLSRPRSGHRRAVMFPKYCSSVFKFSISAPRLRCKCTSLARLFVFWPWACWGRFSNRCGGDHKG